jgi:hypothetical protein
VPEVREGVWQTGCWKDDRAGAGIRSSVDRRCFVAACCLKMFVGAGVPQNSGEQMRQRARIRLERVASSRRAEHQGGCEPIKGRSLDLGTGGCAGCDHKGARSVIVAKCTRDGLFPRSARSLAAASLLGGRLSRDSLQKPGWSLRGGTMHAITLCFESHHRMRR